MPVSKKKQKLYGKVVGHQQNLGYSLEEAKDMADKAVAGKGKKGKEKKVRKG